MNMFCPKCGAKLVDAQARFCSRCGAKIGEKKEIKPEDLPEERIDLREGMTKNNKGMFKYTKWGKRKKKPINWDMEK